MECRSPSARSPSRCSGSTASGRPATWTPERIGNPDGRVARAEGAHSNCTWLIGRELIAQGVLADPTAPAGTGDVRIWRDEDPTFLLIALSGVEGDALLAGPAEPFARFIAATTALVPFGAESSRMEEEISRLIVNLLDA